MACWRGACKLSRGWISSSGAGDVIAEHTALATNEVSQEDSKSTWTAPPPSPAYLLDKKLEQLEHPQSKGIPPDLLKSLSVWREDLLAMQVSQQTQAKPVNSDPEPTPKNSFELITTEEGTGHKNPQEGDTVTLGYAVALQEDGSIIDMRPDFEYCLGRTQQGAGQVTSGTLDKVLTQMRHGQVVSVTSTLEHLLPVDAPACSEHGPDAAAVLEVKLFQIHSSKDCSFVKGAGDVLKEVVKEGLGAWCDNPTDEGIALLRIEEVRSASGARIFPSDTTGPSEFRVTPGNGEVCDALECAMLEMRQHETALITCRDPTFCVGGAPLGNMQLEEGVTFRVTLLDYAKGADAMRFEEEDRLTFAMRRKVEAARLFKEGRFRLSRERYRQIMDLFHHVDRPKSKDRFLGKPELLQACKELRKACRLNSAACGLRLSDPLHAKKMCDAVLRAEPENTKALYRRGQAFLQRGDYLQACNDLQRLLDVDRNVEEARCLLNKATRLREASDRKQRKQFNYRRMIDKMRTDPRSIVHDYMDTPMDFPDLEAPPVADRWKPSK
mmetsp:Transcript_45473/g.131650  ORF Transcript_45473/g.131650 Transcript_45473/m.131650 type:complete len:553 (-) Transcript_45473:204-1862(-)